jgi:hypothetical protein
MVDANLALEFLGAAEPQIATRIDEQLRYSPV